MEETKQSTTVDQDLRSVAEITKRNVKLDRRHEKR